MNTYSERAMRPLPRMGQTPTEAPRPMCPTLRVETPHSAVLTPVVLSEEHPQGSHSFAFLGTDHQYVPNLYMHTKRDYVVKPFTPREFYFNVGGSLEDVIVTGVTGKFSGIDNTGRCVFGVADVVYFFAGDPNRTLKSKQTRDFALSLEMGDHVSEIVIGKQTKG